MAKALEQRLCKRSLGYALIRGLLARPALYFFYRKKEVIGAETVPDAGPVIFCANHQNALMDALVILCTKNRQPVFVGRADIFKKPMIIAFLNFIRIIPIYRKRDGGNSFDNNQETFDLIQKTLHSKQAVGIMPEGTHNKYKRLQTLQKGVFRMALQVQEKYGSVPAIKIIPVGLEYTNTNKFRSDVMIRYGNAIEVSDFYDLYVENQAKAYKKMQDVLSEKMKEGMIHIDNEQHYSEINLLRVMYQRQAAQRLGLDVRNVEHRLQAQQKIIAALEEYARTNPAEMSALSLAVRNYFNILERHNLRDWVIERQPYSLISLTGRCLTSLLGVPFWILGTVLNYLPYKLSALASRKIKDPQFITSVQFVVGMVLFPIYYLIMITLFVIFIPCILVKLIIAALILPLGLFAFRYYISMKKLFARFRFRLNKTPELHEAIELRKYIIEEMGKMV